jgi:hypothetical protein
MSTGQLPPLTPPPGAPQGAIPPPSTASEMDSAFTVMMQALGGMSRAGLAGDPVGFAKFRRILLQVSDVMGRARAENVTAAKPQDLDRQDGVPRPKTPAGGQAL